MRVKVSDIQRTFVAASTDRVSLNICLEAKTLSFHPPFHSSVDNLWRSKKKRKEKKDMQIVHVSYSLIKTGQSISTKENGRVSRKT